MYHRQEWYAHDSKFSTSRRFQANQKDVLGFAFLEQKQGLRGQKFKSLPIHYSLLLHDSLQCPVLVLYKKKPEGKTKMLETQR